jgi:heme A synthase
VKEEASKFASLATEVRIGTRSAVLSQHRRRMLVLLAAAMVQLSGIIAIWTNWEIGATMALVAGAFMCFGLAAEHASAVKALEQNESKP